MDCPACKQPLIVVEHTGIEVDWCPACKGLWFDAGELELLAEMAQREFAMPVPDPAAPPQAAGTPVRTCPRCPAKMSMQTIAGSPPVQVDLCPRGHGIWLDQGELSALIRGMPLSARSGNTQVLAGFLGEVFRDIHGSAPAVGGNPPAGSREHGR